MLSSGKTIPEGLSTVTSVEYNTTEPFFVNVSGTILVEDYYPVSLSFQTNIGCPIAYQTNTTLHESGCIFSTPLTSISTSRGTGNYSIYTAYYSVKVANNATYGVILTYSTNKGKVSQGIANLPVNTVSS